MSKGRPLKQIEISREAYKMLGAENIKGLTINKIVPIDNELIEPYLTSAGNNVRITNKEELIQSCNHENEELYSLYLNGELLMHVKESGFEYLDFLNSEEA